MQGALPMVEPGDVLLCQNIMYHFIHSTIPEGQYILHYFSVIYFAVKLYNPANFSGALALLHCQKVTSCSATCEMIEIRPSALECAVILFVIKI